MKKFLAILLLTTTSLFAQIGGSGTYADPWEISTPGQLDTVRLFIQDSTGYKIFELINDIDCDGVTWMDGDTLFQGYMLAASDTFQFGGNNFTISNLDLRWDTTAHAITGTKTGGRTGFIGRKIQRSYSDEDTLLHDITFDNVRAFWDSTQTNSAAEQPRGAIGIGELPSSSTFWAENMLYNVKFINCVIWCNAPLASTANGVAIVIGSLAGGSAANGYWEFIEVGVENCISYTYIGNQFNGMRSGGFVGYQTAGAQKYTRCYVKDSYIYQHMNPARYEFSKGSLGIFAGIVTYASITQDCYMYGNTLVSNGTYGGNSDPSESGGFCGAQTGGGTGNVSRIYLAGNTYIRQFAAAETDYNCWFSPRFAAGQTLVEDHYIDTTGLAASDWNDLYEAATGYANLTSVGDTVTSLNSAEMKVESNLNNFNFTTTWRYTAGINDGFPHLLWELPAIELTAPAGGESFAYPDTIDIEWSGQVDTALVYYSLDNGFTYTLAPVDTIIGDTIWIPVGLSSQEFKIRITTLDSASVSSSGTFEYLGVTQLTILEPIGVTGIVNDGTYADSIVVQSILADSVNLYYSLDSLDWVLIIENVPQPETVDTVYYYWDPIPQVSGNIWIRATTEADTNKYGPFDSTTVALSGAMRPSQPAICWTNGGIHSALRRDFRLDVSCGWSNPTIQLVTGYVNDDGDGFSHVYVGCANPCPIPVWSTIGHVYIFDAVDTIETTWTEFYDEEGTTVTYKQRLYWIGDSTLYMNDLRNDIDSIALVDLSTYYAAVSGTGWTENPRLGVYNVQWSKISGDTLAINTDFESLNDVGWAPKLIMTGQRIPNAQYDGISYDLLAAPPSGEYAEDIVLAYSAFSYLRYYFRGIHPKIRKH